jgi:hypothetical protein
MAGKAKRKIINPTAIHIGGEISNEMHQARYVVECFYHLSTGHKIERPALTATAISYLLGLCVARLRGIYPARRLVASLKDGAVSRQDLQPGKNQIRYLYLMNKQLGPAVWIHECPRPRRYRLVLLPDRITIDWERCFNNIARYDARRHISAYFSCIL